MKVSFVAGFGPIVREVDASRAFWGSGLGIELQEAAPDYWTNDGLEGVKAFGLWPLSQANPASTAIPGQATFPSLRPGSSWTSSPSKPSRPPSRSFRALDIECSAACAKNRGARPPPTY